MRKIGGPQPGLEGCSRGLYRLIRPRRFVLRAQNSPNATPKPPTGPCWLTCSLTNMPNTGAFSADIRGFEIRKIAVIAPGPLRRRRSGGSSGLIRESPGHPPPASLPSLHPLSFFSCVCACACFSENQANAHRNRYKYAKKTKLRSTRLNWWATERLSALLAALEVSNMAKSSPQTYFLS